MTCLLLSAPHFKPSPDDSRNPINPQIPVPGPDPASPPHPHASSSLTLSCSVFHFPLMELLGAVPRAWGPGCSLARLVLCLLLIQMASRSPTETCLLLRGVAGPLVYGNETSPL